MFSRLLCSVGCTIWYAAQPKDACACRLVIFCRLCINCYVMYQHFIGTIVLSCAFVFQKWGIPRVPAIPMKMIIMFLISGFLNMGNPQVTMGSICFNTKPWPSMTWMIWGTPTTSEASICPSSKVRRRRNHRLGARPLGCSHPPPGWPLNLEAFSWVSCKDSGP